LEKILDYYSIDRLEIGYYCHRLIRFFEKILDYYSIDRLEIGYYCHCLIRFFEKILDCYPIDRLEIGYYCARAAPAKLIAKSGASRTAERIATRAGGACHCVIAKLYQIR